MELSTPTIASRSIVEQVSKRDSREVVLAGDLLSVC